MKAMRIVAAVIPASNWTKGTVTIPGGRKFIFEAKVFDEPSQFGIDGGRISKLGVMTAVRRTLAFRYDRGWDIEPRSGDHKAVLAAIMKRYN